jgi:phosphoenolpyruvate-protein kinase (PTS system EI component)
MIGTLTELRAAKQILADARQELQQANLAYDETMEVGMMIEIPSA